jgi:radical SAM superfamily enzyme with C-terminal helix-hairpin-helix motif
MKTVNRQEHLEDIYWNIQQNKQLQNGDAIIRRIRNISKVENANKLAIDNMGIKKTVVDNEGNEYQTGGYSLANAKLFDASERANTWSRDVNIVNDAGRRVVAVMIPTELTTIKEDMFIAITNLQSLYRQSKSITEKKGYKMATNIASKINKLQAKVHELIQHYNIKV